MTTPERTPERVRAEQLVRSLREAAPADAIACLDAALRRSIASPAWWAASALGLADGVDRDLDRYAPPVGRWAVAGDVVEDVLLGLVVHLEAQGEPWAERVALRVRRWLGWRRRDVERCSEAAQVLGVVPEWSADDLLPRLVALNVRHPSGRSLANGEQSHPRYLALLLAGARRPWLWPWEKIGTLGHVAADAVVTVVVPSDFSSSELDLYSVAHLATPGEPFVHRVRADVVEPWRRRGAAPSSRVPAVTPVEEVEAEEVLSEPVPVPRSAPAAVPAPEEPRLVERRERDLHEFAARIEWGLGGWSP
jgi:hypothetical protein